MQLLTLHHKDLQSTLNHGNVQSLCYLSSTSRFSSIKLYYYVLVQCVISYVIYPLKTIFLANRNKSYETVYFCGAGVYGDCGGAWVDEE